MQGEEEEEEEVFKWKKKLTSEVIPGGPGSPGGPYFKRKRERKKMSQLIASVSECETRCEMFFDSIRRQKEGKNNGWQLLTRKSRLQSTRVILALG